MNAFNFSKHPMAVLAGISGANRISMVPSSCIALAFLLEAAADGIESHGHQKDVRMVERLREHAVTWRTLATERS